MLYFVMHASSESVDSVPMFKFVLDIMISHAMQVKYLHASQKIHSRIHYAHGIDYHHDHMHAMGEIGLVQWCL